MGKKSIGTTADCQPAPPKRISEVETVSLSL